MDVLTSTPDIYDFPVRKSRDSDLIALHWQRLGSIALGQRRVGRGICRGP